MSSKKNNTIIKLIISIILCFPLIYLVNNHFKKTNLSIEVLKDWSKYKRNIDLNNDSITENFDISNIEKDHIYGEIWNTKALVSVISQKGNLVQNTLVWKDIENNGILDAIFLKTLNDSLFLSSFELDITNKKYILKNVFNEFIAKYDSEKHTTECFKVDVLDLNDDGYKDYIFSLSAGAKNRAIYSYDIRNKKLAKSNLEFTYFTNFHLINWNNKTHLAFTSYANGNIPEDKIPLALKKLSLDTTQADKYRTDCKAYMGILDQNLNLVSDLISKDGFTAMIRTIPFYEKNKLYFFNHETYINQEDSLSVIKILNDKLITLSEKRIDLRLNNETFNKFNKSTFQLLNVNKIDKIVFAGLKDTLFEIDKNLNFKPIIINENINSETKIKQFDLDEDGILENIFITTKGLLIFNEDLKESVFAPTPSKINFNTDFEKTGLKDEYKGYYICGNDQKLFLVNYSKNKQYYFKYLIIGISIICIYFLLHILISYQTKKLKNENLRLEKIVKARTQQIEEKNQELELRNELIEEKQKEILDSINYAKRIQYTLLAHEDFVNQHLPDNFILFQPKDIVSGDFYWATEHQNKFYIAVCDCTGHGVPGAFMSLLNIGFLSEAIKERNIEKPNDIFNYVRERLINTISKDGQKDGMDGILICFDKEKHLIQYSAANNAPILISDDQIIELPKDRMPIGKGELAAPFKLYTINHKVGDILYLYTDGYADQFGGPKGKKFKYRQLNELLLNIHNKNLKTQSIILKETIENWKGKLEQVDDICIVAISLK
jgi:serine phosphatase RsbU (regulator of sigma subunit)